jgi:hypothetical protein
MTSGASGDQRPHLLDEIGADLLVARFIGEGAHEARQIHLNGPHAGQPRIQAVSLHLPLVPIDERRIDGHQPDPAAHGERCQEIGLAQTDDGNVDRAADFEQPRLLEVPDDETRHIRRAPPPGRWRDHLRGATEFRERMKVQVRRVEAVDLELEIRAGDRIEQLLQPLDVGRLLDGMTKLWYHTRAGRDGSAMCEPLGGWMQPPAHHRIIAWCGR